MLCLVSTYPPIHSSISSTNRPTNQPTIKLTKQPASHHPTNRQTGQPTNGHQQTNPTRLKALSDAQRNQDIDKLLAIYEKKDAVAQQLEGITKMMVRGVGAVHIITGIAVNTVATITITINVIIMSLCISSRATPFRSAAWDASLPPPGTRSM